MCDGRPSQGHDDGAWLQAQGSPRAGMTEDRVPEASSS